MLDPQLTEADVQRAIAQLDADDPDTGQLAADAWMTLTAGEGPAMVSLSSLQNWAWWLLPKRSHGDDHAWWVETVAAAATLFDRLGATAYAEVCRSDTTAKVLAAWQQSRSKGLAATRRALAASPVEPVNLDDFSWGDTFGIWESDARDAVERALEEAIDNGRLDPASRSWRTTAAAVCSETLDAEHPDGVGQSWRSLVLTERAEFWAAGPRVPPEAAADRQRIARQHLTAPPTPPAEVMSQPLELLAWFADACADGQTLTSSDYLPRTLVVEAAEHHGWWDWEKPPRSEADVWELRVIHRAARRLGVVRKRGRKLATTKAGRTIRTDAATWWPRLVRLGQGDQDYRDAIFEEMALALADGERHDVDDLQRQIGLALGRQGWQTEGRPVSAPEHGRAIYEAINPWRVWGFVDYESARWEPTPQGPRKTHPTTVQATPAGLAAGELWLHHRITGPRKGL
jgi:hypothetical protein